MELNIGSNIKKLRLSKGWTQEQLAAMLNVSIAAVSKWEAKNTYPDITLLFPLAGVFGISVDELMGYNEERLKKEIADSLSLYTSLYCRGEFEEARKLISDMRKNHPSDYAVMNAYMWDIAQGYNNTDSEVLRKNYDELTQICSCILDGCLDEKIRLDALTMKAKLFYAIGETDKALEVLNTFPSWTQSSAQRKESLFDKSSPEFQYWNKKNLYGLIDFMAIKLARSIWYNDAFSIEEKISKIEAIGDEFSRMREKDDMQLFVIAEKMIFSELASKLTVCEYDTSDIIRIRRKQFDAMQAIMRYSKNDNVLRECILSTYKTEDVLQWQIEQLLNSKHICLSKIRENKEYMEFLSEYIK